MKPWSTTSLWSQIGSQLNGQQQVKVIQSDQRCKHQQARFWPPYFGMHLDYLEKRKTINGEYYITLLVHLKEEIAKKENSHKWKRKSALSPRQCTVSQVDHNDSKTAWIALQIASAPPPCSPDLAPSDYWLFADFKRMFQGKRFGSNEEVISETEAYFEAIDKAFYKKGIKFYLKLVLFVRPRTDWVM